MKATVLILVLASAAASATILVEGVNDGPPTNLLFNAVGEAKVQIHMDEAIDYVKPRYLNVALTANQWLGDTKFGIAIELPTNEWPGDLHLKLKRDDLDLPAADFIEQQREHKAAIRVEIPNFAKRETVRVSIGWYGAGLENYGASFSVNSEGVKRSLIGTWDGPNFEYVPDD